jgi:hypothetical protein
LWPSGMQLRPLAKPPLILPPVIQLETSKPPSPCTLSRTADGINIPWRGGDVVADRRKTKAIENAKKIIDKSVSTETNHALEILGECNEQDKYIKPICNYPREREAVIGESDQTSQGNLPSSKATCANMPPKHKYVKPPSGRPPIAWSNITDNPMDDVSPSNDGVAPQSSGMKAQSNRQTAYKKTRFDSVLLQTSGMSAHKEVSLDSILPQTSGGLQDQATNQITQSSIWQADQHPNKTPAFPLELISIINEIRGQPIPVPMEQEFFFDMTQEAAAKNFLVFKQYGFDLGRAIEAQKLSPLGYSSKFKKPEVLQKIFGNHPLWARMERLLIEGSRWPLKEISKEDRVADLQEALQFGYHKGATSKPKLLRELITADVTHGYGLVIPLDKIKRIPVACLAPMNIMHQFTLDASGDIMDREQPTHNQSFKWQSGTLVNKRVIK